LAVSGTVRSCRAVYGYSRPIHALAPGPVRRRGSMVRRY
jgi:hypothetical protein